MGFSRRLVSGSKVQVGKTSGEALTSEEVHEVLGHIAVSREDLADARGALGPRPAWWALHGLGQPLQQALTCKA